MLLFRLAALLRPPRLEGSGRARLCRINVTRSLRAVINTLAKRIMVGEIDEALELLEVSGPEYGGGFSNHGPMAAAPHVALAFVQALLHNHGAVSK